MVEWQQLQEEELAVPAGAQPPRLRGLRLATTVATDILGSLSSESFHCMFVLFYFLKDPVQNAQASNEILQDNPRPSPGSVSSLRVASWPWLHFC